MQKAIFKHYGDLDTIQIVNTPAPTLARGEVLVKVHAAGLNPKDVLFRKGKFKRITGGSFPKGVGYEFSGIIEDGNGSDFQKGDKVFGMINGMQGRCCAEYVNVSVGELIKAPPQFSHMDLAGISLVGQTALQALRDIGRVEAGMSLCINGASGGVGTIAIQIAKFLGAHVTAVSSETNVALCQSLGADKTIDYKTTDLLKSGASFDVFFDVFGNYSFAKTASMLNSKGGYITTVPKAAIFREQFFNFFRGKKAKIVIVKSKRADLEWLAARLLEKRIKPVVDKTFSLAQMKEAQAYIETKRARGKVIIELL